MTNRPSKRWSLAVYEKEVQDMEQDKIQTTKVTKESVESTRRMLRLMNECEDAGVNTLRMLHTQGGRQSKRCKARMKLFLNHPILKERHPLINLEALNRTEGTLEEMDNDLTDSGKTIKRISFMNKVPLVLLPLYLMFKSKPPPPPQETSSSATVLVPPKNGGNVKKSPSSSKLISKPWWLGNKGKLISGDGDDDANTRHESRRSVNRGRTVGSLGKNETDTNTDRFFMKITEDDDEAEIENNLGVVSKHLHELKGHAIHIGTTVQDQNSQLGRIHTKAENTEKKITEVRNKTKKLVDKDDSSDGISTSACFGCVVS